MRDDATRYRFDVRWGDERMAFQDIDGLEASGGDAGILLLRRGVAGQDSGLWAWFDEMRRSRILPAPLTVVLAAEGGGAGAGMRWQVTAAVPVRVTGIELRANRVAVEIVEFAHAGMTPGMLAG